MAIIATIPITITITITITIKDLVAVIGPDRGVTEQAVIHAATGGLASLRAAR
ncbi:MAG: hypothetical protein M3Y93_01570 [Pseudomonadota bacterium]|nr:hypothetical protein [Pseudomonadota bacterium]